MKRHLLLLPLCMLVMSACAPTSMIRDQRIGLSNALSETADKGGMPVSVYGAPTVQTTHDVLKVMQGHNHGPELPLKLARDTGTGVRMIVVLEPGFNVYGSNLCEGPDLLFDTHVAENSRVVFAICNNDLLYSIVSATYRDGRLAPVGEAFEDFYRQSFRYLTDLKQDRMARMSACWEGAGSC